MPAARRQRGRRVAGWLVVEGDESDRSLVALRPRDRGRDERRARPPRDLRLRGRARALLRGVARATCPTSCAAGSSSRSTFELAVPGAHNRRERRRRARGARARGSRARRRRSARSRAFAGVGRRFELVGERGGVAVFDDYGHNPTEIARDARDGARAYRGRPDRRLPAARLRAHAPPARASSATRSGWPTRRS